MPIMRRGVGPVNLDFLGGTVNAFFGRYVAEGLGTRPDPDPAQTSIIVGVGVKLTETSGYRDKAASHAGDLGSPKIAPV